LTLLVADVFQPLHSLAVKRFLNGDVRHGGEGRGTMPMLLARRAPRHIAGANFLNGVRPSVARDRSLP